MGDIYFITFGQGEEVVECNTRGEAEVEIDSIVKEGYEIREIIKGRRMKWTVHTEISLEKETDENDQRD